MATSRLHANSNAERLDINETVRVMEGLGSKAALLQEGNKASFQTLYSNVHLGAVAANRLAASAAESSLDETTPPSSDVEALSTSEEEAAAAAAGARRGSGRGRKQGVGRGSGKGRRPGGGDGGGHGARDVFRSGKKALRGSVRGKTTKAENAAKAERVQHAGRRRRMDRYAAPSPRADDRPRAPQGPGRALPPKERPAGATVAPHRPRPSTSTTWKIRVCRWVEKKDGRSQRVPDLNATCLYSCRRGLGASPLSTLRTLPLRSSTNAPLRTLTRRWQASSSRARVTRKCAVSC